MIRVLICDDQAVVREGLELILAADPEIEVVGLAENGYAATELVEQQQPELVLMDLKMPVMNGIKATQQIKSKFPEIKILVLTTFGEDEWVFDAIRSGASGYLLKGTPREDLIRAVKGTIKGEAHIDPGVGSKILDQLAKPGVEGVTNMAEDLKMPIMNGIKATQQIKSKFPDIKILVLTTFGEDEWVFDAIRSGASGYLLKGTPREDLIRAVKGTIKGEAHIDPGVGSKILDQLAKPGVEGVTNMVEDLSKREVEVLKLIARGLSNSQIAEELHLSQGTVRNYVSAILAKLEVSDRTQAAVWAIRYGLA